MFIGGSSSHAHGANLGKTHPKRGARSLARTIVAVHSNALEDICTLMRLAGAAAAGVIAATHEDRSDFASRRSLIDIGDALKH